MNPLSIFLGQTPRGKPDIVEPFVGRNDPIGGLLPALQVVFALLLVVALLKYALPKLLARWGAAKPAESGASFQIEETIAFAGGHLYVVQVRGRMLLLAGGAQGVRFLTDLGQPEPPDGKPAFFELVDEARTRPETLQSAVVAPEAPEPDEDESQFRARQALNRLRRIAQ